ncbi:MAG: radical SAM protein [Promethearchaeota archaeon]|nr:MAG: radical SAM protein [Candidatus Lokiarchaeota archaeon]
MSKILYSDVDSEIPLYGLDFLGIIDRGTNIIELKPITLCNLKCRYCFVNAGNYENNFIIRKSYLIDYVKHLIEIKGAYDLEIHLAPYGEIFLYPQLRALLEHIKNLEGVNTISLQTNGLLLNPKVIQMLEEVGVTRVNISLNTFNKSLAEYLTQCTNYEIENLLENIQLLLDSKVNVLLAPVWFPGENDEDIEDIIQFVVDLRDQGYSKKDIQLGIQKYLIYKTGRKLKKIRPKTWGYFYQQLSDLEKKYDVKLKLGPDDFGIHPRPLYRLNLHEGDKIPVTVVSKGRWNNECIGKINEKFGCKILLNSPIQFTPNLLGKEIDVRILKAKNTENLITTFFPPQ